MKTLPSNNDGIIFGKEHESPLFIRKVTFEPGYTETGDHLHPNSFEYYIVLSGNVTFRSGSQEQKLNPGDIVFFKKAEPHRIISVESTVEMLLFKETGVTKIQL